ncbi:DNA-directed RNA polymerase subunit alpha [Candidatus Shapirobacteria bacterium CG09_land_8_20_14_0_10_38_17]|uniref:DNA-directed RNA polymerase subunit alpha n=1 Tax=Candidatus Shapirobacteria bacterium CG09_land_8_20_14_0_10_38_17 TaxID=1974884 RepID=A0A2H0WR46_9BACT|nr:MAG: DNA-directed RNA polymerase subunit alpha [Candidatus Shapirobacteria bacterium CG09_land_8_20_14_0_10_38_17]
MDLTFSIDEKKIETNRSQFEISPLQEGFGHTLGNSLRRALLTALPGAAITNVKFSGAQHQFTTLPGVKEDLVEVILNFKKVRLSSQSEKPVTIKIDQVGSGQVVAGDIKTPATVRVINKNLVLAHLADKKTKLAVEMIVEQGFGYSPADERKASQSTVGLIPIDAIFTPILKVNYFIDNTRVGRVTNYDKLTIDILTDGTITPKKALKEAAKILVTYFNYIYIPNEKAKKTIKEKSPRVLKLSVAELDLSARTINALEKGGYKTAGDILRVSSRDLMEVKNLGKKSIALIGKILRKQGVDWV